MAKPLGVVAVIDLQSSATGLATDLERSGHEPSLTFASSEEDVRRLSGDSCDLVVAFHPNPMLPPKRVLEVLSETTDAPPVVVYSRTFADDEIVALVQAGAHDCVRHGDNWRLKGAIARPPAGRPRPAPPRPASTASEAAELQDHHRALIEEIPALTYVCWADETRSVAYVSPQLLTMTGYSPGEWLAEPNMWADRLHPEDREKVLRRYREACRSSSRFACEYRIMDREGGTLWWRDEGRVMPGPDGSARFVRGFVLDVTEQKLAEEALRRMRFFDQLTGLPNRALMQLRLGTALAKAKETERPLALLILALDRFRDTVNTLGYHNGDAIIRDLAGRLADAIGDTEQLARLRGDEFGVLLPDAGADLALQVGGRILKVFDKPVMIDRLPIEVSASVGIAVSPDHGEESEPLLRRADAAVQAARKVGGGACVLYSPEHDPHNPEHLAILGELRRALEADDLLLHYQPKVDLKRRTVVGAEALLRWPHAKRGMVPPGMFIPLAEQTGLMRPLTRWVLDRAAQEARAWQRAGYALPVAVNVSARSLHDRLIVDDVVEALRTNGLDSDQLLIEVTESAVMADATRAAETLSGLTRAGVGVSIDDFGTGYSSLALLRQLKVSELKIDKSFVMGMAGETGEDTAIVRSTNDLGHNLGLTVVAEGVEDEWTLDLLSAFGCDLAQGYFIARPMPASEIPGWIAKSDWKMAES
jgi:diguanylate cyclase (GGDEF)-like protein/PAS domain S-box-containing protein